MLKEGTSRFMMRNHGGLSRTRYSDILITHFHSLAVTELDIIALFTKVGILQLREVVLTLFYLS